MGSSYCGGRLGCHVSGLRLGSLLDLFQDGEETDKLKTVVNLQGHAQAVQGVDLPRCP